MTLWQHVEAILYGLVAVAAVLLMLTPTLRRSRRG